MASMRKILVLLLYKNLPSSLSIAVRWKQAMGEFVPLFVFVRNERE
jgi:hypothetical protein